MMREMMEAYLQLEGYQVSSAYSGEKALEMIAANPPDLILLDGRLGGISGFEVCAQLKSDPAVRHIPVVMVTALSNDEDKKRAIETGVDDFVGKPLDTPIMFNRIRTLLRGKRLYDRLGDVLKRHTDQATADAILADLKGVQSKRP